MPGRCGETAAQAERLGFDGLLLADSQNLVGDVFVELGVLARTTDRLGLGTGVINPVTRHPAVTAAAIATVQLESGGRAVLGIGRGDSSLAQLGLARPSTARLAEFVGQVRGFLHGETVTVDGHASRIGWITGRAVSPVPVELAATGPATIAGGRGRCRSRHAQRRERSSARRLGDPDGPAGPYRGWAGPGYAASGRYVNVGCYPTGPSPGVWSGAARRFSLTFLR